MKRHLSFALTTLRLLPGPIALACALRRTHRAPARRLARRLEDGCQVAINEMAISRMKC
jgi:hypothetical protein